MATEQIAVYLWKAERSTTLAQVAVAIDKFLEDDGSSTGVVDVTLSRPGSSLREKQLEHLFYAMEQLLSDAESSILGKMGAHRHSIANIRRIIHEFKETS